MAVYALGDIQGCFDALQRLLDRLNFDPAVDRLWFAGDLVNRGPDALSTVRFVKQLGAQAVSVLGNHDLHLLAIAADHKNTRDPGLLALLDAEDSEALLHWLRHRPLLHADTSLGYTLVHAGIYPRWSQQQAEQRAEELQAVLRSAHYPAFIHHMYGNLPKKWHDDLIGWERLRFICNTFTRMRYCTPDGALNFKDKGPVGTQLDTSSAAWFDDPQRQPHPQRILFGHWSTLGLLQRDDIFALDTGCLWGGQLSALRIDLPTPEYISIDCPSYRDIPN